MLHCGGGEGDGVGVRDDLALQTSRVGGGKGEGGWGRCARYEPGGCATTRLGVAIICSTVTTIAMNLHSSTGVPLCREVALQ